MNSQGVYARARPRAEDLLWERLRGSRLRAAKFKRQVPIDRYVADFYCHDAKLVVEIDGKQHGWHDPYDEARTKVLEAAGVHVMRFDNREVPHDLDKVLRRIGKELRLPFD